MAPIPYSKPETVLKRAQELLGVSQPQAALTLLFEHLTSKRTRTNNPISAIEPLVLLFLELCVEHRRGKLAKDGLYQFKNAAQNTNIPSIETAVSKFIEMAEAKVAEAQAKADEAVTVEDLEATETPESILLSTVSDEQSRDRTDRAIVTPWLKFLWETYRTVLDILKNNARLETMYQTTAHRAFQFCLKYTRKTEFRRLCELLRNHLQNAAKYSHQMHAIDLNDPETLQRHLDTRFEQLNVAVELELWQEAFRSVEDIHTLLNLSKRPAKTVMMANYLEKLARIFHMSDNFLFHAAALNRHFHLLANAASAVASGQASKKDNPATSEADLNRAASFVLLSTLSIPVISTSRSRGALVDADEARKNKNTRLASLLGMPSTPTRAGLLKDFLTKGLLKRASAETKELYNILEVDFHPLSICKRISPILAQIGADAEMEKYIAPLQQVILTRLFQQLSQVYESVEVKFVLGLAQFPDPHAVDANKIERFIMNGCKKGDLAIRIDHASGVLTFDSDIFSSARALHPGSNLGSAEKEGEMAKEVQRLQSTPAEIVRSQLQRLAKTLYITCQYVDPSFNEERRKTKATALQRAKAGVEQERADILSRRDIIDRKKQAASTALAQKEKDEATKRRIRQQKAQQEEIERLAAEQRDREQKRLAAEKERIQREEFERQLQELKQGVKGVNLEDVDFTDLDPNRIRIIKLRALEQEKNDVQKKNETAARRLDHLERAMRKEELKYLPKDYEQQQANDHAMYERRNKQFLKDSKTKHENDVATKHRLSRMLDEYDRFKGDVESSRAQEFQRRRDHAQRELERLKQQRISEVKARKLKERKAKEEEERRQREEEERLAREAEERAAAEEKRRQELAERKARAEEERRKLDEAAAKQRQREAEAEARLEAKRRERETMSRPGAGMGARTASGRDTSERAPASEDARPAGGPPRLNLSGASGKPSWRERMAAKERGETDAAEANPPPAAPPSDVQTEEAALPRKTGGYVPPGARQGGAPARAPREGARDGAPSERPQRYNDREGGARGGDGSGPERRNFGGPRGGDGEQRGEPRRGMGDGPPRGERTGERTGGRTFGRDFDRKEASASPAPAEGSEPPPQLNRGGADKWVPPHLRNK